LLAQKVGGQKQRPRTLKSRGHVSLFMLWSTPMSCGSWRGVGWN